MTELPHLIYLKGLDTYDVLHNGIPPKALEVKRRAVRINDLNLVNNLIEASGILYENPMITPDMLNSEIVAALVIMNDLSYTAKGHIENEDILEENHDIDYDGESVIYDERTTAFVVIQTIAEAVNKLYVAHKKKMSDEGSVRVEVRMVTPNVYGECFEIALPSNFGDLTQESVGRLIFNKNFKRMSTSFNSLATLRGMTSCLISQSNMRTQPTVMFLKNSTISDFTSAKHNSLVSNSVFQLESNMNYTSPVQHTSCVIANDLIRSVIARNSAFYLKSTFGDALSADYLNTSANECTHMINMVATLSCIDIVAFAGGNPNMTQVYLPVQTIVGNRKMNIIKPI
jgi:hypothetical protein